MKRCVFAALAALMLFSAVEMAARTDRGRQMGPRESRAEGIGITFGYVNSSYKSTDWATDEVERAPALNGFTASLTKDFTLVRSVLYLQTGLGYVYQTRTRNSEAEFLGGLVRTKVIMDRTEHFMTLPVRLKYTLPLFGRIGVSVDAGPVFLAGLSSKMGARMRVQDAASLSSSYDLYSGKFKTSGTAEEMDAEQWLKTDGGIPEGRLKRFDVMLGASVGADFFSLLEVRAGYDWGLVNKYRGDLADEKKMYRGQFTLSVGLRF